MRVGDRVRLVKLVECYDDYWDLLGEYGEVLEVDSTEYEGAPIAVLFDGLADEIYFSEEELLVVTDIAWTREEIVRLRVEADRLEKLTDV